jgi:hypothetical protein
MSHFLQSALAEIVAMGGKFPSPFIVVRFGRSRDSEAIPHVMVENHPQKYRADSPHIEVEQIKNPPSLQGLM